MTKRTVFISYAHADEKFLKAFTTQLNPLIRHGDIDAWSDQRIALGQDWHKEIQTALARASAAVLLISAEFLDSTYISNSELPALLKAAKERGLKIFPIILSPCPFEHAEFRYPNPRSGPDTIKLSSLQAANPPSKTLTEIGPAQRRRILLSVAIEVARLQPAPIVVPQNINPTPSSRGTPLGLLREATETIRLLKSVNIGANVAEHDSILYEARIETTAFTDLFSDKVDLIPGNKGSGKTALYRLISEYLKPTLFKTRTVILTGVEASGDPVFQAFRRKFEALSEMEFESFWRVYFVALILERFINNPEYSELTSRAAIEVEDFRRRCRLARIPEANHSRNFRAIVEGVLSYVKTVFTRADSIDEPPKQESAPFQPAEYGSESDQHPSDEPIFLNDLHASIVTVLNRANVKLWIM
jgi:hypothetical protein